MLFSQPAGLPGSGDVFLIAQNPNGTTRIFYTNFAQSLCVSDIREHESRRETIGFIECLNCETNGSHPCEMTYLFNPHHLQTLIILDDIDGQEGPDNPSNGILCASYSGPCLPGYLRLRISEDQLAKAHQQGIKIIKQSDIPGLKAQAFAL